MEPREKFPDEGADVTFDWILAGAASAEIARLQEQCERYEAALIQIRDNEGTVCDDFGHCDHAACRSSYRAWLIADRALR